MRANQADGLTANFRILIVPLVPLLANDLSCEVGHFFAGSAAETSFDTQLGSLPCEPQIQPECPLPKQEGVFVVSVKDGKVLSKSVVVHLIEWFYGSTIEEAV